MFDILVHLNPGYRAYIFSDLVTPRQILVESERNVTKIGIDLVGCVDLSHKSTLFAGANVGLQLQELQPGSHVFYGSVGTL